MKSFQFFRARSVSTDEFLILVKKKQKSVTAPPRDGKRWEAALDNKRVRPFAAKLQECWSINLQSKTQTFFYHEDCDSGWKKTEVLFLVHSWGLVWELKQTHTNKCSSFACCCINPCSVSSSVWWAADVKSKFIYIKHLQQPQPTSDSQHQIDQW